MRTAHKPNFRIYRIPVAAVPYSNYKCIVVHSRHPLNDFTSRLHWEAISANNTNSYDHLQAVYLITIPPFDSVSFLFTCGGLCAKFSYKSTPWSCLMKHKSGFTLIELLIVVAIIGILAAIAVPNFMNAQTRAKIAKVISELRNLSLALEQYSMDNNNQYPDTAGTAQTVYKPLYKLTSPVPYMASLPSRDLFLPPLWSSDQAGGTRDYWWDPYWLATFTTTRYYGKSQADVAAYRIGPMRYILASVGPDKEFNGTPFSGYKTKDLYWVPYTPTNGLRSIGDLFYYGPGGTTSDAVQDKGR